MVFTLTLVAVNAPHVLALRPHSELSLSQILSKGLESGASYQSMVKQKEVAVSTLAPLLAALDGLPHVRGAIKEIATGHLGKTFCAEILSLS